MINEFQNMKYFYQEYYNNDKIIIPQPFISYKKFLIMEYVNGTYFHDLNVTTIKKGVSNTNSKTHVKWISDGNVGGTRLEGGGITRESNVSSRIEVELVTIDSMELEELHYLKIDVEGFEEMVIQGAEKTIAKFLPLIIIECFESIETGEIASEETLRKRFKYLYDLGYIHNHIAFEDFLFIPPTIK